MTHPGTQIPDSLFRKVVEQARDYAVFVLDPEGRILTWNLGAQRIKGYAPEEILGRVNRSLSQVPIEGLDVQLLVERVAPRLASSSMATLLTGANVSTTRHARIRREKLSITACRYARLPSSSRMTVVSICHISSALVVRSPTFGFAGCTRRRGRRQPYVRTRRYQVEGEAQTLPSRWARTASGNSRAARMAPSWPCRSCGATKAGLEMPSTVTGPR